MQKKFVIIENGSSNLIDHEGYAGQPVTILNKHENNLFTVWDRNGNQWHCGEDELIEIPSLREALQSFVDYLDTDDMTESEKYLKWQAELSLEAY